MSLLSPSAVMFPRWSDDRPKKKAERPQSHANKTCDECGDDSRWWPGDATVCNGCEIRKALKC